MSTNFPNKLPQITQIVTDLFGDICEFICVYLWIIGFSQDPGSNSNPHFSLCLSLSI